MRGEAAAPHLRDRLVLGHGQQPRRQRHAVRQPLLRAQQLHARHARPHQHLALRDIKPGEEMTLNYVETYHDDSKLCRCGAPSCHVTINPVEEAGAAAEADQVSNARRLRLERILRRDFEPYAARGWSRAASPSNTTRLMLYTAAGETQAEMTGRLRYLARGTEDLPAVGDWVVIAERGRGGAREDSRHTAAPQQVLAQGRGERDRRADSRGQRGHGLSRHGPRQRLQPPPHRALLIMAWESGAEPVVVLNKADLVEEVEERSARESSGSRRACRWSR